MGTPLAATLPAQHFPLKSMRWLHAKPLPFPGNLQHLKNVQHSSLCGYILIQRARASTRKSHFAISLNCNRNVGVKASPALSSSFLVPTPKIAQHPPTSSSSVLALPRLLPCPDCCSRPWALISQFQLTKAFPAEPNGAFIKGRLSQSSQNCCEVGQAGRFLEAASGPYPPCSPGDDHQYLHFSKAHKVKLIQDLFLFILVVQFECINQALSTYKSQIPK